MSENLSLDLIDFVAVRNIEFLRRKRKRMELAITKPLLIPLSPSIRKGAVRLFAHLEVMDPAATRQMLGTVLFAQK
ncbi:hypothetical protein ACJ72_02306 [Emergomyces africanus]|uniref:Uncharacterized protein n=1 Tax=Emergomyces africanus TaxID=1955775 RepID=A0A1B7P386_9EURO|nr:hypothetical protein ACJ72_02306 [Emergomyces africanus]